MIPNFYYDFGRSKTKFYVTLPEVYKWAYEKQNDSKYGGALALITNSFDSAHLLFNGSKTYTDPQTLHDETPATIHYPTITTNSADLLNYYFDHYENRPISKPVEIGKIIVRIGEQIGPATYDDAMYNICEEWNRVISRFVQFNSEKYLRLLALLNLKYNPIDNYDGHEFEDFGYIGKETMDRDVKAKQLSGFKITGPSTDAAITQNQEEDTFTLSGNFDNDYKKNSALAQVGDTKNGQIAGNATVTESSGVTTASTTTSGGTQPKSSHYTTTYDDAAQSRLESYDTNDGTVATSQKGVQSEDVPTMIEAYSGAPNNPSYTDTRQFDGRSDKRELLKYGNMGVTTSQQMITQEREMLLEGWNVVETFCNELNKELFLQCYDF